MHDHVTYRYVMTYSMTDNQSLKITYKEQQLASIKCPLVSVFGVLTQSETPMIQHCIGNFLSGGMGII